MEKVVPIIPIRDGIIFPNTDSVLTFGRPKSLAALEISFAQERIVCFVLQKSAKVNDPSPSDIYRTGTLCRIERMIKSEGEINAQVRGISRVKIVSF
ncbi:MAG: LON peptidase substrate-binding domain-containing protein, partial [Patescibacteria group bacterium]